MIRPPKWLGLCIYFCGKPVQILLLIGTRRAYVVIEYDNCVLLTKDWLGMHKKWRLPGGGMHRNETPMQAAIRETQEETGVRINQKQLHLLTPVPVHAKRWFKYWVFHVHIHEEPKALLLGKDIIEARFIPIKKLLTTPQSEELTYVVRSLYTQ